MAPKMYGLRERAPVMFVFNPIDDITKSVSDVHQGEDFREGGWQIILVTKLQYTNARLEQRLRRVFGALGVNGGHMDQLG